MLAEGSSKILIDQVNLTKHMVFADFVDKNILLLTFKRDKKGKEEIIFVSKSNPSNKKWFESSITLELSFYVNHEKY